MDLRVLRDREEVLRQEIRQLTDEQRKKFYRDLNQKLKDPDTYATLNYLFITGLHHFYLHNTARGWCNLLVFVIGLVLLLNGLIWQGFALLVTISVVELKALFQSEAIVMDYNNRLMEELLLEYRGSGYLKTTDNQQS